MYSMSLQQFSKIFSLAAWRGATGLSATSPANAQYQRASGFPLLSLAEVHTQQTILHSNF
jgi:hypothetical protein